MDPHSHVWAEWWNSGLSSDLYKVIQWQSNGCYWVFDTLCPTPLPIPLPFPNQLFPSPYTSHSPPPHPFQLPFPSRFTPHMFWRCSRVTGVARWNYTPHFLSSGPRCKSMNMCAQNSLQAHEHVCPKQLTMGWIIAMIKQQSTLAVLT